MEKYIEKIIEIILENVSCEHQEIKDEYPKQRFDDVTYSLGNEQEVIKKCLAVIPKVSIDNKFIEEKTIGLIEIISKSKTLDAMSFIRSLINEVLEKIKLKGD